jgi:hypothetical protein
MSGHRSSKKRKGWRNREDAGREAAYSEIVLEICCRTFEIQGGMDGLLVRVLRGIGSEFLIDRRKVARRAATQAFRPLLSSSWTPMSAVVPVICKGS